MLVCYYIRVPIRKQEKEILHLDGMGKYNENFLKKFEKCVDKEHTKWYHISSTQQEIKTYRYR